MEIGELTASESGAEALGVLAVTVQALAGSQSLVETLERVARAACSATGAEAAILRVRDGDGLVVRAIAAATGSLPAELHGARIALADVPEVEEAGFAALPDQTRAVAGRAGATVALVVPIDVGGRTEGLLELVRAGEDFDDQQRIAARLAAGLAAAALRILRDEDRVGARRELLEVAGDALAAAADADTVADPIARLVARASGAADVWLWAADGDSLALAATHGEPRPASPGTAEAILLDRRAAVVDSNGDQTVATFQLGQPPIGALQLRFPPGADPDEEALGDVARFAVRAAHALRAGDRTRRIQGELDRSRALLDVLGQAISELSLAHTLETAAERVTALLSTDRVAVYIVEGERLVAGHAARLGEGHEAIAARLLQLALGPSRGRGALAVQDTSLCPR